MSITFGTALRAARIGYGLSTKHNAYIRVTDEGPDTLRIVMIPLGEKLPSKGRTIYYAWWEVENGEELLTDLSPAISRVKRVKKSLSFVIDKQFGELVNV